MLLGKNIVISRLLFPYLEDANFFLSRQDNKNKEMKNLLDNAEIIVYKEEEIPLLKEWHCFQQ